MTRTRGLARQELKRAANRLNFTITHIERVLPHYRGRRDYIADVLEKCVEALRFVQDALLQTREIL
jgi:hypothetical protein